MNNSAQATTGTPLRGNVPPFRRGLRPFRPTQQSEKLIDAKIPERIFRVLNLFDPSQWVQAEILFTYHDETRRLFGITRSLDIALTQSKPSRFRTREQMAEAWDRISDVRDFSEKLSLAVRRLQDLTGTNPRERRKLQAVAKESKPKPAAANGPTATPVKSKNPAPAPAPVVDPEPVRTESSNNHAASGAAHGTEKPKEQQPPPRPQEVDLSPDF